MPSVKVSRILHAGYTIESDGTQIVFDPIFENPFSVNCFAYPNVQFDLDHIRTLKFSAVFISHYHDDHCSLESLKLLDRKTPIYLYCLFEEMFDLIKKLGFENVIPLELNKTIAIGAFQITPRKALDEGVDSIFHIRAGNLNILNVVDSWIDPATMNLLKTESWDLILWPFQSMREIEVIAPDRAEKSSREIPPELSEQLQILNPKYLVPSSCQFIQEDWSWYRKVFFPVSYARFQRQIRALLPKTQMLRMNPSASYLLDEKSMQPSRPLPWVRPLGDQNVDYDYDENIVPTPTSEIVPRFPALAKDQAQIVDDYCRVGLLAKFRSLDLPEDIYFSESRVWQLSVFNHEGLAQDFFYRIDGEKISLTPATKPNWITEIPQAKFYGALVEGETLTSLYIRIVGSAFEDIVDDPLIRCLFHGVFGAYQKAQLKRIAAD